MSVPLISDRFKLLLDSASLFGCEGKPGYSEDTNTTHASSVSHLCAPLGHMPQ